jgi:hypothetical protein
VPAVVKTLYSQDIEPSKIIIRGDILKDTRGGENYITISKDGILIVMDMFVSSGLIIILPMLTVM